MIITDELVRLANGDVQLLLGVLAHEIAHVELQHSLGQLYRSAGAAGLIMVIAGDVGNGVEHLLLHGSGILALSHSRAHEAEADRRSVELMRNAGYDPVAIGRFFALLEETFGDTKETLSTHRLIAATAIQAYARKLLPLTGESAQ